MGPLQKHQQEGCRGYVADSGQKGKSREIDGIQAQKRAFGPRGEVDPTCGGLGVFSATSLFSHG